MKNFRNIIIFMLIAFIALVAFQWYWIENAIAVKKEQFDKNVVEAMNATVAKIEKQEVIFLAKQKLREQERKRLEAIAKPKRVYKPRPKSRKKDNADPNLVVNQKPEERFAVQSQNDNLRRKSRKRDTLFPVQGPDFFIDFNQPTDFFIAGELGMPEHRMRFIRQMLEDQNRFWQSFDQGSQMGLNQNQGINDVFDAINAEIYRMEQGDVDVQSFVIERIDPLTGTVYLQNNIEAAPEKNSGKLIQNEKRIQSKANVGSTENKYGNKLKKQPEKTQNVVAKKEENVSIPYEPIAENNEQVFAKTINKAELIKDVFTDFLHGDRSIYERLNQQMLDTLLNEELKNRGIGLKYEYGVKNTDKMIFTSYDLNYDPSSSEKAYNVRLFPNDAMQQEQFLYVYFPERDNLIMGNMNTVFGTSIALILLIGGIFYASINTMFQQKRLSIIKNDFINNMTHEFKTPISTISLAVEVMKDDSVQKDKQKTNRYLGIIKDENTRLGGQVEKVLQMALLDQGKVKLTKQDVDLHEVIEQVYQNLSVQIEQKGGEVVLDLAAENATIAADEVHITNIIYNLLDNANKYSTHNPQISVATRNSVNQIEVTITDKGIGMSKDHVNRIFDKFYRVSSGNVHDVKGFGLGLSYVKKMIDLHEAKISVESRPKEGTTFTILFDSKPKNNLA